MRTGLVSGLLVVAVLLGPTVGLAGFVQHGQGGDLTYVQEGKIKSLPAQPDAMWMIFDLKADRMTMVDPVNRRYAQGSSAEYCEIVQRMQDTASSLLGAMGLDLQQQQPVMPAVTVRREGPGGKVAGFATTRYSVLQDGRVFEEVWLTDDPSLLREMEGSGRLARMECGGDKSALAASAEYAKMMGRGWPLRTIAHQGGESYSSLEVVRIDRRRIPATEFQPPPGYRQVPLADFFGLGELESMAGPETVPAAQPEREGGRKGGLMEMLKGLEKEGFKLPSGR